MTLGKCYDLSEKQGNDRVKRIKVSHITEVLMSVCILTDMGLLQVLNGNCKFYEYHGCKGQLLADVTNKFDADPKGYYIEGIWTKKTLTGRSAQGISSYVCSSSS